jgi:hypothetical protein
MRFVLSPPGVVLALFGAVSCSGRPLPPPAGGEPLAGRPPTAATYQALAFKAGGVITAADASGRPRFIRAVSQTAASATSPEAAARAHFARFAPAYGIQGDPLTDTGVAGGGRTPRGDHLVRLRQQVGGIEIYRSDVKVVMRPDLSLVALSGSPSAITGGKPADRRFPLTAGQALARALADLYATSIPDAVAAQTTAVAAPYLLLALPPGAPVRLSEPARAKPVYFRDRDQLVAAYFIEFFADAGSSTSSDAYSYVVAASDGRVIDRHNLTADVAFRYRVFAETTGERRPLDGPIADFTPHPTGMPDGSFPAFVPPALISMESFKTSPPFLIDPWLPGTAMQTLGNNVDAYADLFGPDGFSNGDLRASTTAPGTFDRTYDVTAEPGASAVQTMAATTNLFYLTNWLHDYWYDSGFDEAAGNAQANNFGRGGQGADPIHAEAQDAAGLNNANMTIPSDGLSPRMQMYLWSPPSTSVLTVGTDAGPVDLPHGGADFGPVRFDLTADLVVALDGTGPPTDGCQPLTNDVAGKIVLIDRGVCTYVAKAQQAQAAGATGVIIANNVAGLPPNMGNTNPPTTVAIPAMSVTLDGGNQIKALLGNGPVHARLFRDGPAGRDGSLDNMIVAHEWGHYFHHRLSDCSTFQCAGMSEGWADFIALHMALREGDNLGGTYGAGIYAPQAFGDSGYFGIRRFPYSADFTRNGLTLGHVQNAAVLPMMPSNPNPGPNSEVHNAGEVWASMLFEAYVALHKNPGTRTFAEVRRAFANYLVLGLQLAPTDATYAETRDAILIAISMTEPSDVGTIAAGFARRGLGTCAIAPPRDSSADLAPVTQTFTVQPKMAITAVDIDDSVESCDSDGILDRGETGRVQIQVANNGPTALAGTQVTLSSPTSGVVFPEGPTITVPDVAAFGSQSVTVNIALADSVSEVGVLDLTVTATNDAACVTTVTEVLATSINVDEVPASSATEDVEANAPPWSKTGAGADNVWSRATANPPNHAFLGANSEALSDTQLVSPPINVSATGNFQISFDHAFSFEFSSGTFWDGGMIEISADDGATWQDISAFASPGYNATVTDVADNPLAGRAGFGSTNASFPATDKVTLDLGAALAGQTVRIRFRIGTDSSVGAPGWLIDNIALVGAGNTPFIGVVPHAGNCQVPPVASAGTDRTVNGRADVILDASGSDDANDDPLTFLWTQTAGPPVSLLNQSSAVAAFRAPQVRRRTVFTFQVQVSDPTGSSTDSVDVTVRNR